MRWLGDIYGDAGNVGSLNAAEIERLLAIALKTCSRSGEALAHFNNVLASLRLLDASDNITPDLRNGVALLAVRVGALEGRGGILNMLGQHEDTFRSLTLAEEALIRHDPGSSFDALDSAGRWRSLCTNLCDVLMSLGRIENAIGNAHRAVTYAKKSTPPGKPSPIAASSFQRLAIALFRAELIDDCNNAIAEALSCVERGGGAGTYLHADMLSVAGTLLISQERAAEALPVLERALVMVKACMPTAPDHALLQRVLAGIAFARRKCGMSADEAESSVHAVLRRSQLACAGPGCERKLQEDGTPLDVCVKCRRTFYCGKVCQTADWNRGTRRSVRRWSRRRGRRPRPWWRRRQLSNEPRPS